MNRITTIITGIVGLFLASSLLTALWQQHWNNVFMISLVVALSSIPYVLQKRFNIRVSSRYRTGFILFIFATIFLGEVNHYYEVFPWWDLFLHFIAGGAITIFGFSLLHSIYQQSRVTSVPLLTSVFAFSFSGMLLGVWEVYEFAMDQTGLAGNMQPSSADTMYDLIVGYAAAFIVCVFGYRYLKFRERNFAATEIEKTKLPE